MTVRVAFVNNMPDSAFEAAEKQFANFLGREAVLSRYWLPGTPRGPEVQAVIAKGYQDLAHLYRYPPELLVVTGAEPRASDLPSEPYWPALEELLWWARSAVPVAVLSCLAAHGALWSFDSLARQALPQKCSGVFPQALDSADPLVRGVGPAAFVHSRWNEVATSLLVENDYGVVAGSEAGWTVAVAEKGRSLFVLFQGHPEYEPLTLLREYRRDARRYLSGQGAYPQVPVGYLDGEGESLLAEFEQRATSGAADVALMGHFPFYEAARHVKASWKEASMALAANVLRAVRQRSGAAVCAVRTA
ncbi:MAG: homoserine O-acetyltransferase/O-succinyltransferase family protein [Acidimicrobiales bacterium]